MLKNSIKRTVSVIAASAMLVAAVPSMSVSASAKSAVSGRVTVAAAAKKAHKHNYKRVPGSKVRRSPDGRQWMYVQCTTCKNRTFICVG